MFPLLIILFIHTNALAEPIFNASALQYEIIAEGLVNPTSITFVNNDILIIEKEGNIRLVLNQNLKEDPIQEFLINSLNERCLLGIETNGEDIFVYLTQITNNESLRNRVYQ